MEKCRGIHLALPFTPGFATEAGRRRIVNSMIANRKISVLFVCTGNICRSPTAEGVFQALITRAGLEKNLSCDSAGTHGYHIGEPPDLRAQAAARRRGYDLSTLRARQVVADDFSEFDLMLAMDLGNLAPLGGLQPANARIAPVLFLDYVNAGAGKREVADPYYGNGQGFEVVLDAIEDGAAKLLTKLSSSLL